MFVVLYDNILRQDLAQKRGRGQSLVIGGKRPSSATIDQANKRAKTMDCGVADLHTFEVVEEHSELIVWLFPPHGWTTRPKVVNHAGNSTLELHIRQPPFKLEDAGEAFADVENPIVLAKVELRKKMQAKAFQVYRIPLPIPVYGEKEFVLAEAFGGKTLSMKLVQVRLKIRDGEDSNNDHSV